MQAASVAGESATVGEGGCAITKGAAGLYAAGAAPVSAQAEEQTLDRDRMTQFVRAHMAINDARDEFHGKVGRIHEEQGRERARQEMEAQVTAILEENEMTRERYDEITMIISLNGEMRTLFEEVVKELEETGS